MEATCSLVEYITAQKVANWVHANPRSMNSLCYMSPEAAVLVLRQLGSRVFEKIGTDPDERFEVYRQLSNYLYLKNQSLLECDITDIYYKLLAYIVHDKHNKQSIAKFFSVSKVPQKIAAAKWLLSVLANEKTYEQGDYQQHVIMLNSGDLGIIFNQPVLQAYIHEFCFSRSLSNLQR